MEFNAEETDFYYRHKDGTYHPQKERLAQVKLSLSWLQPMLQNTVML